MIWGNCSKGTSEMQIYNVYPLICKHLWMSIYYEILILYHWLLIGSIRKQLSNQMLSKVRRKLYSREFGDVSVGWRGEYFPKSSANARSGYWSVGVWLWLHKAVYNTEFYTSAMINQILWQEPLKKTKKTRKSSCVNARGISSATQQSTRCSVLWGEGGYLHWPGGGVPTQDRYPLQIEGRYSTPRPFQLEGRYPPPSAGR